MHFSVDNSVDNRFSIIRFYMYVIINFIVIQNKRQDQISKTKNCRNIQLDVPH